METCTFDNKKFKIKTVTEKGKIFLPQVPKVTGLLDERSQPGFNVIKHFFFVTNKEAISAKAFVLGKPFQPGLIFVIKDRSCPSYHLSVAPLSSAF